MPTNDVITGDSLEVLAELDDESVHAVVTDPPYGIAFMGNSWDDFKPKEYQEWCEVWGSRALRVLKPGGHLIAFSGSRTYHRLACGVEDAGFEIRDKIDWLYGTGFPKGLNVGKAVDKALGAERDVVGYKEDSYSGQHARHAKDRGEYPDTPLKPEPASDAGAKWDGWSTQLKPAHEPAVLARKPLSEGTVAENVLEHGTGALNIDACRIAYGDGGDLEETQSKNPGRGDTETSNVYGDDRPQQSVDDTGRYPPNVVFEESEARELDREVGDTWSYESDRTVDQDAHGESWFGGDRAIRTEYGDSGGPSRYFYCAKASKSERSVDGLVENDHPTVKPVDLMSWLVKLVTADGQTVLDPFAGSGSTGLACRETGREYVLVERDARYADIARARLNMDLEDPSRFRDDDDAQQGLAGWDPLD